MGLIQERDVTKLLPNQELMDHGSRGLVKDEQMDALAGDVADRIVAALQGDTDLRQRLLNSGAANEAFKRKLVNRLIEEARLARAGQEAGSREALEP